MLRHLSLALGGVLALAGALYAWDFPTHYRERLAGFEAQNAALPADRQHVVLLGDSQTEGWELGGRTQRYLPTVAERVLNRGIAGDGLGLGSTRGIRHRLDASVFDCDPSHVVLLAGVNDVGRDGSGVTRSADHYATVVASIRERLPDTELILVTLAPARGRYAALNPHILAYNRRVRAVAAAQGAALLDLHALLADDQGLLRADWTGDGLHWTNPAYARYGHELERLLAGAAAIDAPAAEGDGIIDRLPR